MALKKKVASKKVAKKAAGKKAAAKRVVADEAEDLAFEAPRRPAAKKAAGKKAAAKKVAGKKTAARKKPARKKAPREEAAEREAPPENPAALALARKVGQLLSDKKAHEVVVLDVRGKASYADYLVVASGESDRQVSAMAEHVLRQLKETQGTRPLSVEGMDTGDWVLLDYGEVVTHLFFTEKRAFYDIEGLWADAPREKVA
jgi:ribosome-associated protein